MTTTFYFHVSDGTAAGTTPENLVPVISSNGGGSSANISLQQNNTYVTTVVVTNLGEGSVPSFSISGGADAAKFAITPTTGILSFLSPPSYGSPTDANGDNIYEVIVKAETEPTLFDTQALSVQITNAVPNTAPTFTSYGGVSSVTGTIPEGNSYVTAVSATDAETPTQLVYSISGGADAASFSVDSVTGVLSFITPPVFSPPGDANGDNVYLVTVRVTDPLGLYDEQSFSMEVQSVTLPNATPVITSNGGSSFAVLSQTEGSTAVTTVQASDPDAGDSVTYSITGGADAARFNIHAVAGTLTFLTAPNYDSPLDSNSDNIYEVVVTATDTHGAQDSQTISVQITPNPTTPPLTATRRWDWTNSVLPSGYASASPANSTYRDANGYVKTSVVGTPRVHHPVNGGSAGLLVEPASTQLVGYTNHTTGSASGSGLQTLGSVTGPNNVANSGHTHTQSSATAFARDVTVTANKRVWFELFIKTGTGPYLLVRLGQGPSTSGVQAWLHLPTMAIVQSGTFGTGATLHEARTESWSGWTRVLLAGIASAAATTVRASFAIVDAIGSTTLVSDSSTVYWHQFGVYQQDFRPVTPVYAGAGSSVIRPADAATENLGSWFANFSSGTWIVDATSAETLDPPGTYGPVLLSLDDGTTNNETALFQSASANEVVADMTTLGNLQASIQTTGWGLETRHRVGFSYTANVMYLSRDGVVVPQSGSFTLPSTTVLRFGHRSRLGVAEGLWSFLIHSLDYYNQALDQATLIDKTYYSPVSEGPSSQPPLEPGSSWTDSVAPPTTVPLTYLGSLVDAYSGATLKRITDATTFGGNAGSETRLASQSPKVNAFGPTGILLGYPLSPSAYCNTDGTFVGWVTAGVGAHLSRIVNDLVYGFDDSLNNAKMWTRNARTNSSYTIVHDFATNGYNQISHGFGESSPSADERYWAIIGRRTSDGIAVVFCYDRIANSIVGQWVSGIAFNSSGAINGCTMSKSGDYIVVQLDSAVGDKVAGWHVFLRDGTYHGLAFADSSGAAQDTFFIVEEQGSGTPTEPRDRTVWPYASDSPWNTPLGSSATYASGSDTPTSYFRSLPAGFTINSSVWSIPVYFASASDPLRTINVSAGGSYTNGSVTIRCPANAVPSPDGNGNDRPIAIVDPNRTVIHEFWNVTSSSNPWSAISYTPVPLDGQGVGVVTGFGPDSYYTISGQLGWGGTRAYGGSNIGGLIRTGELTNGIKHAIAIAFNRNYMTSPWVWPATRDDWWESYPNNASPPQGNASGAIACGHLFAIPPSVNLSSFGLGAREYNFLRAIQLYGAIIVDMTDNVGAYMEQTHASEVSGFNFGAVAGILSQHIARVTNYTQGNANPKGGGTGLAPAAPSLVSGTPSVPLGIDALTRIGYPSTGGVSYVRLSDLATVTVLPDNKVGSSWRVSGLMTSVPGEILLSCGGYNSGSAGTNNTTPQYNVVVAVAMNGLNVGKVRKWCYTYHAETVGSLAYTELPLAVPNKDGTKLLLGAKASNSGSQVQGYLATWYGNAPAPAPAPAPSGDLPDYTKALLILDPARTFAQHTAGSVYDVIVEAMADGASNGGKHVYSVPTTGLLNSTDGYTYLERVTPDPILGSTRATFRMRIRDGMVQPWDGGNSLRTEIIGSTQTILPNREFMFASCFTIASWTSGVLSPDWKNWVGRMQIHHPYDGVAPSIMVYSSLSTGQLLVVVRNDANPDGGVEYDISTAPNGGAMQQGRYETILLHGRMGAADGGATFLNVYRSINFGAFQQVVTSTIANCKSVYYNTEHLLSLGMYASSGNEHTNMPTGGVTSDFLGAIAFNLSTNPGAATPTTILNHFAAVAGKL